MSTRMTHRRARESTRRPVCTAVLVAAIAVLFPACSLDGILGREELPPEVSDPAITKTAGGAMAAYRGTLAEFRHAFGGSTTSASVGGTGGGDATFVGITAMLSDEVRAQDAGASIYSMPTTSVDARILPEQFTDRGDNPSFAAYSRLQRTRSQAGQAIELLKRYAPDSSVFVGHLYALQGFTEVFLAELYCSGIPLSTIDFDGDWTLKAGSTTDEVLGHALALFDSALASGADSARFVNLAHMGRARALLNLGRFAEASIEAIQVPDGYSYTIVFSSVVANNAFNFARLVDWNASRGFTVSDREGVNGVDFRTSNDPRTRVTARGTSATSGQTIWHPNKYAINGSSPIVLANWIEARLIQAEAALQAGDATTWLALLNQLRQAGITPSLVALSDPGNTDARVNLLFRERAFWLFLTGHRQGDLRRLVRQYGRPAQSVYPSGPYAGTFSYGSEVTAPVPGNERLHNPQYGGCFSRGA